MEKVNILVTDKMDEECLEQIAAVGPEIKLKDVSDLSRAEHKGDETAKKEYDSLLAGADVLYGNRIPRDLFGRAPKLKWIQVTSAGVERFLTAEMLASPVLLTNVSGIHATPIGEFVLGLMLMFVKQAPLFFQGKQEKQWQRGLDLDVLRGKTVGIVGLGNIGREVARLCKAFGMKVMATRRSVKRVGKSRFVDIILPTDQLPQLLAESDFVVLTLSYTPETDKIIGEKELRAMKPSAHLINIARGGVIDEEALIRALEEDWIKGAGLDVFAVEPLPEDSKLWELPNVILSPHVSGSHGEYDIKATGIFTENLRRYLDGRKLLNIVDKKRGY